MILLILSLSIIIIIVSSSSSSLIDESNKQTNKDILLSLLKKVSGVYNNINKQKGLEKTVLITACNHGFINHLKNFKCFADRLDMKFLVFAMDNAAHNYIIQNTNMLSYNMGSGAVGGVTEGSTTFRSKQFNLITAKKKEAVHDILLLGYNVIFTDTDVAIVRDPFKYMLWDNVDYVHSLNTNCKEQDTWTFRKSKEEGNTGFYFVRSNNMTIKLWQDAYEAAPKHPRLDDQAIFWNVIRKSVDPPILPLGTCKHYNNPNELIRKELTTCFLDTCVFSSGMLSNKWVPEYTYDTLLQNVRKRNESICSIHANYISGNQNKKEMMKVHGYWLADEMSNKCLDFNATIS